MGIKSHQRGWGPPDRRRAISKSQSPEKERRQFIWFCQQIFIGKQLVPGAAAEYVAT
jgi:hypothetical protein